jgi:hypothetical protein
MYLQMAFFLQVFELKPLCIAVLDSVCDVTHTTTLTDMIVMGIMSMKLCITEFDLKSNICTQNIVMEIKQYQKKWLQNVNRMDTDKVKQPHYRP